MKQIYKLTRTVLCGTASLLLLSGCKTPLPLPENQTTDSSTGMGQSAEIEGNPWVPGVHPRKASRGSSGAIAVQSSNTTLPQQSDQSQTRNQSGTLAYQYHEPVQALNQQLQQLDLLQQQFNNRQQQLSQQESDLIKQQELTKLEEQALAREQQLNKQQQVLLKRQQDLSRQQQELTQQQQQLYQQQTATASCPNTATPQSNASGDLAKLTETSKLPSTRGSEASVSPSEKSSSSTPSSSESESSSSPSPETSNP